MEVIKVLVFVLSMLNFVNFREVSSSRPVSPLRLQISGVCTKSAVYTIIQTQKKIRTITVLCPMSKDTNCRKTKSITYLVRTPKTARKFVEVCCPGFRKIGPKCEPICTVPCENGLCTQPNFCTCYPLYRKISEYHCAPICNDCNHGICIFPNQCKCFANYQRHMNGSCLPVCKNECINSECTSPDRCSCHEGYLPDPNNPNVCTPICNLPCGKGGSCNKPDICLCEPNYRLNETNQCEPVCNTCENGVCIEPGVCECNDNYRLERSNQNETRCEAIVSTTMEQNDYVTEYYDEMTTDYDQAQSELIELSSTTDGGGPLTDFDDVPNAILDYFTTDRIISYRRSTDRIPDYTTPDPVRNTTTLSTISVQILNSTTVRILIPSTTPQVVYINETIEIECDSECFNGECADGVCLCDEGYYESELIPNHCDPICEFYSADGCVNGTCTAPNTCKCYDGYIAISDHICISALNSSRYNEGFVKPQTGIQNLVHKFTIYFIRTVGVLLLITIVAFIVYKWYNRRLSYRLHSTECLQYGAQYMAEDDGCEL